MTAILERSLINYLINVNKTIIFFLNCKNYSVFGVIYKDSKQVNCIAMTVVLGMICYICLAEISPNDLKTDCK
jgi:hypothetical protein